IVSWDFVRVGVHRLSLCLPSPGVFHSLFLICHWISFVFLLYGRRIATHSVDPSLTHFLGEFPDLGLALLPDVVVPEAEPGFQSGLSPIARIHSRGNPLGSAWGPGLLVGGLYSPSNLSVIHVGYL